MYNEEIKTQYLTDASDRISQSVDNVMIYFRSVNDTEEALKKDVSNFNLSEIMGYYKSLKTFSKQYLCTVNAQLSKYAAWCQSHSLLSDNQNHFLEVNSEILEACVDKNLVNSRYVKKERLMEIINRLEFSESESFLLLALFEGICGREYEEIRNLYPKDFNGNIVSLSTGRQLEVSDKLVELAKESATIYFYETNDERGNRKRTLNPSDNRCFKYPEKTTEDNESMFILRRLRLMRGLSGYNFIDSKALKESGRIDMILGYMHTGDQDKSPVEVISLHRADIEYRYGKLLNITDYVNKYSDMWK